MAWGAHHAGSGARGRKAQPSECGGVGRAEPRPQLQPARALLPFAALPQGGGSDAGSRRHSSGAALKCCWFHSLEVLVAALTLKEEMSASTRHYCEKRRENENKTFGW